MNTYHFSIDKFKSKSKCVCSAIDNQVLFTNFWQLSRIFYPLQQQTTKVTIGSSDLQLISVLFLTLLFSFRVNVHKCIWNFTVSTITSFGKLFSVYPWYRITVTSLYSLTVCSTDFIYIQFICIVYIDLFLKTRFTFVSSRFFR